MKDRTKVRESILRLLILFVGLTIAHLGVTLFLLADQGADPFNVLIQGLRLLLEKAGLSLTHGTVHMGVCSLIILILLLADRRYIKAGTVVCMFCGGQRRYPDPDQKTLFHHPADRRPTPRISVPAPDLFPAPVQRAQS